MIQEEKQLLLIDLCARLPYSPFVQLMEKFDDEDSEHFREIHNLSTYDIELFNSGEISNIKPFLRPMSSMTEEESAELSNIISEWYDEELFYLTEEPFLEYALQKINYSINPRLFDWLNKKMFDYRGLIPKGLAIEVTEEFNPYKN